MRLTRIFREEASTLQRVRVDGSSPSRLAGIDPDDGVIEPIPCHRLAIATSPA